jgi:hypothetical protein
MPEKQAHSAEIVSKRTSQVIQALTRGMVIVNMRPVHTIPL